MIGSDPTSLQKEPAICLPVRSPAEVGTKAGCLFARFSFLVRKARLLVRNKKQKTNKRKTFLSARSVCIATIPVAVAFVTTIAYGQPFLPGHKAYPVLGACESSEDAFPPGRYLMIKDPINRLSQDYHSTVSSIVEAHLKPRTIRCTEDVREVPSGELSALAAKLPPWKDSEDRTGLRETDIGVVLLEYLRVYECALNEQRFFLPSRVAQDVQKDSVVGIFDHLTTFGDRLKRIKQELFLARMTLDRTLTYLGGMDRLRPVDASLECLQRSSLDIRNILGLTADVSACLPRAWDARTSLRDPPNSSSGSQ